MTSTIVKQALDAYAHSNATTFAHDRSQTLGASEVGQCARKVWYLKNEIDPQQKIERDAEYNDGWGARMRGTVFEDKFWVPAMRAKFGDKLMFAGRDEQKTLVSGFLSATPDGLLVGLSPGMQQAIGVQTDCVLVECKTVDPRTNLVEAKDENVFQTHVQMGLMRETTHWKPTHSIISYTDASWWNDVKEFVVAFDPKIFEHAKARAMTVMTALDAAELKPEGWIAGGRECNYCPFTGPCGVERRNLPFQEQPVDPQFAAEIRDMALRLTHMSEARKDYEAEERELQDEIKNRLREKGVKKIPGVVSWSPVKGRSGYRMADLIAAAEAAGIDTEQFATEGTPGDRLTISVATQA